MDGWSWNTSFLLGRCYVSFREGKHEKLADALSIFFGGWKMIWKIETWTCNCNEQFTATHCEVPLPAPPGFQKTIWAQVYTHYICIDGQSLKRATMLAILVQFVVQCLVTCFFIAFLGNLTPILNSQKKDNLENSSPGVSWCPSFLGVKLFDDFELIFWKKCPWNVSSRPREGPIPDWPALEFTNPWEAALSSFLSSLQALSQCTPITINMPLATGLESSGWKQQAFSVGKHAECMRADDDDDDDDDDDEDDATNNVVVVVVALIFVFVLMLFLLLKMTFWSPNAPHIYTQRCLEEGSGCWKKNTPTDEGNGRPSIWFLRGSYKMGPEPSITPGVMGPL